MLEYESAEILDGQDWNWHIAVDLGVEMNAAKARENDTDYWSLSIVAEHPRHPEAYLCEVKKTRGQAPSAAAEWIRESISWVPTRNVKYEKVRLRRGLRRTYRTTNYIRYRQPQRRKRRIALSG